MNFWPRMFYRSGWLRCVVFKYVYPVWCFSWIRWLGFDVLSCWRMVLYYTYIYIYYYILYSTFFCSLTLQPLSSIPSSNITFCSVIIFSCSLPLFLSYTPPPTSVSSILFSSYSSPIPIFYTSRGVPWVFVCISFLPSFHPRLVFWPRMFYRSGWLRCVLVI